MDFFSAKDVMINGTSILGRQEEEGRGRYCSFKKHLRPAATVGSHTAANENNGFTLSISGGANKGIAVDADAG